MHQTQKVNINEETLFNLLSLKISTSYVQAELFFKRSFSRPTIRLDLQGNNAGTANSYNNLLRFNKSLFFANQQHFLEQTVPHEVAHLIAYQLFGLHIKPHGKEWQHIMQIVYQLPAERCHHYPIIKKKKCYYLYNCQCANLIHPLTARRHYLISQGYQYICNYCRKTLHNTGKIDYH